MVTRSVILCMEMLQGLDKSIVSPYKYTPYMYLPCAHVPYTFLLCHNELYI